MAKKLVSRQVAKARFGVLPFGLPSMDLHFLTKLPFMAHLLLLDLKGMYHCGADVCIVADFRYLPDAGNEPCYRSICLHLTLLLSYPALLYQWCMTMTELEEQLVRRTIDPAVNRSINYVLQVAAKQDLEVDLLLRTQPETFQLKHARVEMPLPGYVVAHLTLRKPVTLLARCYTRLSCCVGIIAQHRSAWSKFVTSVDPANRAWLSKS